MTLPFYIALLFFIRMVGLFAFMPLAKEIVATNLLSYDHLGMIIGSYGLTQAFFQYPIAVASDRWGRVIMIRICLLVFGLGSFLGYFATSNEVLLLARLLQGSAALGSTALAFMADYYTGDQFQKNYYLIGISIFLAYAVSFAVAALLSYLESPNFVFIFMGVGSLTLFLLSYKIKNINLENHSKQSNTQVNFFPKLTLPLAVIASFNFIVHALQTFSSASIQIFYNGNSSYLFFSAFVLSVLLTLYPLMRRDFVLSMKWSANLVYLGVFALILFNQFYVFGVLTFALCIILEASLPSILSKYLNQNEKGSGMGFNSSCQYLGYFCGGLLAHVTYSEKLFIITHVLFYLVVLFLCYVCLRQLSTDTAIIETT